METLKKPFLMVCNQRCVHDSYIPLQGILAYSHSHTVVPNIHQFQVKY